MKAISTIAIAALSLAASAAYADTQLASTGNGELVLFVKNNTSGVVYARGTGVTLDQILTESAITTGSYNGIATGGPAVGTQAFAYALPSLTADGTLSTFLAAPGTFSWGLMAGDTVGGIALGAARYATTSLTNFGTTSSTVTNANLGAGSWGQFSGMQGQVNGNIAGTTVLDQGSAASGGQWDQTGASPGVNADTWFGAGNVNNSVGLGQTAKFYVLASSGGTTSLARVYQGVDVRLTVDGLLEAVGGGGPEVPLPPALWLLGSALVGLTGVARRRNAAAPVAA